MLVSAYVQSCIHHIHKRWKVYRIRAQEYIVLPYHVFTTLVLYKPIVLSALIRLL